MAHDQMQTKRVAEPDGKKQSKRTRFHGAFHRQTAMGRFPLSHGRFAGIVPYCSPVRCRRVLSHRHAGGDDDRHGDQSQQKICSAPVVGCDHPCVERRQNDTPQDSPCPDDSSGHASSPEKSPGSRAHGHDVHGPGPQGQQNAVAEKKLPSCQDVRHHQQAQTSGRPHGHDDDSGSVPVEGTTCQDRENTGKNEVRRIKARRSRPRPQKLRLQRTEKNAE